MPESTGNIIIDESIGKPTVDAGPHSDNRSESGSYQPEILYGSDTSDATERFDTPGGNTEQPKRKRGRPAGSRNNTTGGTVNGSGTGTDKANQPKGILDSGLSLEGVLYSIHLMGAEFLKCKEIELEKDESKKLADAIAEVNRFYNVKFDPKKVAVFNLAVVTASIYGPMTVAIKRRLDAERGPQVVKTQAAKPQTTSPSPVKHPVNGVVDFSRVSPSDVFGSQDGSI